MKHFSQIDQNFAKTLMGTTQISIKRDGCLITDLAMITGEDPTRVNKLLTTQGGYVKNSNVVLWEPACKALGLGFDYRYRTYDNAIALDAIKKYGFVLAEVDYDGNQRTKGNHWILLTGNHFMEDPLSMTGPEKTNKYKLYTGLAVVHRL